MLETCPTFQARLQKGKSKARNCYNLDLVGVSSSKASQTKALRPGNIFEINSDQSKLNTLRYLKGDTKINSIISKFVDYRTLILQG